ncbi:uncharacterized protein LOC123559064 [Mercenaria mercenaria]|uniref:uncharacterized protein LOC123559064 n=1 Tax=Mercenaria mercenaria TaxID=6596 RepID=UPI00234E812A|nr:uncharacterized protein LOC123559064 [Mercenaria mercenaria]XP_053399695.1 uncharacterized protein LOC123559064 [Mercenaria mercenaria]
MGSKSTKECARTDEIFCTGSAIKNRTKSKKRSMSSQINPDVTKRDIHERCKRMIYAQEEKLKEAEENIKRIENENADKIQTLRKIMKTETENMRKTFEEQLIEKDKELVILNEKLYFVEEEKDGLLLRLSAMAGAKLTEGNANIADLSDENRPTKLAEKYSELYDNEWTDAFDVLTKDGKRNDQEAIQILAKSLCVAYSICRDKANEDLNNIIDALRKYHGVTDLPTEILKEIKDQRKKLFRRPIGDLRQNYKNQAKTNIIMDKAEKKAKPVKIFVTKSLELCWLMAIQDPPVFVDINIERHGEKMDTDLRKPYTTSGKYIEFIVWPTLYLHKGGNVLLKGVAQCMSVNNKMEKQNSKDFTSISNASIRFGTKDTNTDNETTGNLLEQYQKPPVHIDSQNDGNAKNFNAEVATNSLTDEIQTHPIHASFESQKAKTSDKQLSGIPSKKTRKKKSRWSKNSQSHTMFNTMQDKRSQEQIKVDEITHL